MSFHQIAIFIFLIRTPHRNIYIRHNKLIHSNEGDFVCTGCDKRFTKRRYLTTHKKYHCFSPNPASENADGSDQPESSMNRINRKHRWIGSTENVDGSDQPESSSLPIQEPEHPTMLVVDSAQVKIFFLTNNSSITKVQAPIIRLTVNNEIFNF